MVFDHANRKAMNVLDNAFLCLLNFFSFIYSMHLYGFCRYVIMYIVFCLVLVRSSESVRKTFMAGN